MKTTLEDSRIDEQSDPRSDSDPATIRDEITDAVKRVEKKFNASTSAFLDTLEEGRISAERLVRRGRNAAELCLDDATYRMKRNPLAAAALLFGAGAMAGVLFGLVAPHVSRKSASESARNS